MPFYGWHSVLIKGYKWKEVEYIDDDGCRNTKPKAIYAQVHDPDALPNDILSFNVLKFAFCPAPNSYWVVLGFEDYAYEGIFGHDTFVMRRGSYYGGPSDYNPKDLNIDDFIW